MRDDLKLLLDYEEAAEDFRDAKETRDKNPDKYEKTKAKMTKLRGKLRASYQPEDGTATASPETLEAAASN